MIWISKICWVVCACIDVGWKANVINLSVIKCSLKINSGKVTHVKGKKLPSFKIAVIQWSRSDGCDYLLIWWVSCFSFPPRIVIIVYKNNLNKILKQLKLYKASIVSFAIILDTKKMWVWLSPSSRLVKNEEWSHGQKRLMGPKFIGRGQSWKRGSWGSRSSLVTRASFSCDSQE